MHKGTLGCMRILLFACKKLISLKVACGISFYYGASKITALIFLCVKYSPNGPKFGVKAFFGITNNPKGCMRQISRKKNPLYFRILHGAMKITVLIFLCVKFSPNDPKFGVEAFFGITNNPKGCMRQISRKKISALFSYTIWSNFEFFLVSNFLEMN